AMIEENNLGEGCSISLRATWFALPPIQDPASVPNPRHTSSGPAPPTIWGANSEVIHTAIGTPNTIPTVPVKNIKPARLRRFHISFRFRFKVKRIKHDGRKKRLPIPVRGEFSPSIILAELSSPGIK